jgi:hypothetical protein
MKKRKYICGVLALISALVAIGCVVAAVAEGNANTFSAPFAIHKILLWIWLASIIMVMILSRFSWPYFSLFIFAPLAIWPIPSWMFILFRVLRIRFAP